MTVQNEMVERVAHTLYDERKRICEEFGGYQFFTSWDEDNEVFHDQLRREARAVIAAMREPTENMYFTGDREYERERDSILGPAPIPMWRAMIDEALK